MLGVAWLVRANVRAQLGIPMEDLAAKAAQKAAFMNVVNRLRAADSSARTDTPSYRHGSCPVNHPTKATMSRCRNQ